MNTEGISSTFIEGVRSSLRNLPDKLSVPFNKKAQLIITWN